MADETLSARAVREMLSAQSGPVCKCVKIEASGAATEVELDMAPSKQAVQTALGGPIEFLGQWEPLGVVLVALRQALATETSKARLPKPFDELEFEGPLLLLRSDDDGAPKDFGLEEYEAFAQKEPEPWQLPGFYENNRDEDDGEDEFAEEDDDDDDDEEEDDDDDEDDDEDEQEGLKEMLLAAAVAELEKKEGRSATAEEKANVEKAVTMKLSGESEGEVIVLQKVCAAFEAQHGRAPTPEEIDTVLEQLRQADANADDDDDDEEAEEEEAKEKDAEADDADEEEDDDDDDEDDEEDEDAAESDDVLEQLVDMFKEKNGRDPTEDEVKHWITTIKDATANAQNDKDEPDAKRAKTAQDDAVSAS
eukprot:CAMPEP_0198651516 /NCGR_PEP_ID=MMETSP1467-20131203/5730_1 /TAXON_ID=1462469 /ORGANISM="unid. sp., Strain CCMP2135" /LENGTH=364 /DNA_ID=CAMNT_0044387413 /DNA_START=1 /DNA_END=1095 /DNA_ORIENTATION=-